MFPGPLYTSESDFVVFTPVSVDFRGKNTTRFTTKEIRTRGKKILRKVKDHRTLISLKIVPSPVYKGWCLE